MISTELRLENIDVGWAQWSITLNTLIYAAIPLGSKVSRLSIIKPLLLGTPLIERKNTEVVAKEGISLPSGVQKNSRERGKVTLNGGALKNLIESFISLIFLESNLKWLTFANDHTFIIPNNLDHFLRNLASDLPVYSGNKLQR